VVHVLIRSVARDVWGSDEHLMAGGAEAAAQRLDVHLGAAEAVGKVPAESMDNFHRRSNTLWQALMTSRQSWSLNAAEIGRRTSDAATRSVTGKSAASMSRDWRAYGAECSGT